MIRVKAAEDDALWAEMADDVKRDTLRDLLPIVTAAGERMRAEVVQRLRRIQGRPSRVGEAPALQSGDLAGSFSAMAAKVSRSGSAVVGGVRSTEDYRKIGALEYGSTQERGGTIVHLRPRPFLRPAEEVTMQQLDADMGRSL